MALANSIQIATTDHSSGSVTPSIEVEPALSASNKPFASSNWKRSFKSSSTPHLPTLANGGKSSPNLQSTLRDLNTVRDPRSPSPLSVRSNSSDPGGHHPDLSNEVAALSTKLINAINQQTHLDDQLQGARAELEAARARIAELEDARRNHIFMMQEGLLVSKSDADRVEAGLKGEIVAEKQARNNAEKEKRGLEQELENLTSGLFEEANAMVSTARKEHEETLRINEQLKAKLSDTEMLLVSHQEQLRDLKSVLQQIQTEEEFDGTASSTGPSTPATTTHDRMSRSIDYTHHSRQVSATLSPPQHPLHFAHLVTPILRNDLPAYEEFSTLFRPSIKQVNSASRTPSGNFVGLNIMGTISQSKDSQSSVTQSSHHTPTNSNSASLATSSSSPNMPGAFNQVSPSFSAAPEGTLKENKFYKRTFNEDIEPTLRLDTAPGLSWLARRNIVSALLSGALIVEPFPPSKYFNYSHVYTCALCGEARSTEPYIRRHRFRTSDSDDAQRYPLCDYCLARVRATGDFVTFLRMVRAGHWSRDDVGAAWEECARLRERMFWARLGGGVVPAAAAASHARSASSAPVTAGGNDGSSSGLAPAASGVPASPLRAAMAKRMSKKSDSAATINIPDGTSLTEEREGETDDSAEESSAPPPPLPPRTRQRLSAPAAPTSSTGTPSVTVKDAAGVKSEEQRPPDDEGKGRDAAA